ncbi:MAG TPA: hypothetical protein VK843_04915 [Planctomycetota bacterium]|nr:hypothetical protein [Planctomycetota bacterium]
MSAECRRMAELRAAEWHALFPQAQATGHVVKAASLAKIHRHPWLVTGVVALVVGVGTFAAFRYFSTRKEKKTLGETAAPTTNGKHEFAKRNVPTGLIVDMLTNAARAWIVHSLTQPPPAPKEPIQPV